MAYSLVITTCPDDHTADSLADFLVSEGLAACVTVLPGGRSVYEWQGQVARENEQVVLIKTRADRYPQLEAAILEKHPYELPEIIAVPIEAGLSPYLAWIDAQQDKKR